MSLTAKINNEWHFTLEKRVFNFNFTKKHQVSGEKIINVLHRVKKPIGILHILLSKY